MWEIDLGNQIATFLLSIPLGCFFALLFFVFEAFRIANNIKGIRLWIRDIVFFVFAGLITFCFLLVRSNGEIRGYVLFGIAGGFWLFKRLVSKIVLKCLVWLIRFSKRQYERIYVAVGTRFLKIYRKICKTLKKLQKYKKKGLKMQEQLVYTETNNIGGSVTDEFKSYG